FSTGSTILEATGSGTTVLTAFRDDSFIMDGLTLAGGSSPGSGGGLYGQSCAGRISDCTFISNSAYDRGAGAYLTGSGDFVIERCSFLGNTSAKTPHYSEGGGLYSSPTSGSSLTLRECVFRNNGTITEGAAILAAGSSSNLIIEDCVFEENFFIDPGFPRLEFSVLHRRGGASTRVINTVFRNNRHVGQFNFSYLYTWTISTSGSGGTTSFEHCDIVDNIGLGGLRLGSGALSDCLIERNEGAGVSGGELLIEDCRIADHAALGVRSAGQDSVTVISRCTIENNGPYVGFSPTTTPGGLDLSGSSATILDSFIQNNVGTNGAAGGIDCGARQLILRNSVIAGNSATGTISTTGGIFFRGENLRIDNCSFNGNRAFRRFFSELTPNALGAALASDVQVANSII
ncbi:MAG: right-handed parallel beta-helix repeat-containing protein, partial [Candidatus Omnitrophica bacterium]|nr:right-handed parallel beta-helix repeat-containing protein [Candidatus Omnitrophota bacterium]